MNFPATTYEMSTSPLPFVPPERYPSPPKDMWYEVPKEARTADAEPLKPIFPWEANRPTPSRVFVDNVPQVTTKAEANVSDTPSGEPWPLPEANPLAEPPALETSTMEEKSEPLTPLTPAIQITPAVDLWSTYTRTNAWDELPEINRYVDTIQKKHQRTRSLKAPGVIDLPGIGAGADEAPWRRRGNKVTDFPSEDERPSLPVTPAPIRRPTFWGGGSGMGDAGNGPSLPAAANVPGQSDWVCLHGNRWTPADCLCDLTNVLRVHKDPVAQLEKLARQQSEQLLEKLSGTTGRDSSDLPPRLLPFGSEKLASPTYVAQSPTVISPRPVKASPTGSSSVLNFTPDSEATPRASPRPQPQSLAAKMAVASPSSPGGRR
jgi:glycogenin